MIGIDFIKNKSILGVSKLTDITGKRILFPNFDKGYMGRGGVEFLFEEISYESGRIKRLKEKIKSSVYMTLNGTKKKKLSQTKK